MMSFLRVIITLNPALDKMRMSNCRVGVVGKRRDVHWSFFLLSDASLRAGHLTVWDEVSDWQAERGYVVLASELSTLIRCFFKVTFPCWSWMLRARQERLITSRCVWVNGESVFRYFYIDIRYSMMVAYGAVQVPPLILILD